ncbi:MAG TPA: hypothetical protein VHY56_08140, partial [Candidatus Binataceae bacterium]|nr:hypothetical protein [Candidatus Binataceae bacterium]
MTKPLPRFVCATILFLIAAAPPTANAASAPAPIDPEFNTVMVPPAQTASPIPVKVGIYILNLVSLDEVEQTFSCTGYLAETWNDPRLAFTPQPGESRLRFYRKTDIWFPLLQFDNSTSPRRLSSYLLTGSSDGTVSYSEKFAVSLSSNMQLRAFPFDSQDLQIVVHPFTNQQGGILLRADPARTGISSASYTPLPLWHTGTVRFRAALSQSAEGSQGGQYHVTFQIRVVRNSEYYIYRIFLPLAL